MQCQFIFRLTTIPQVYVRMPGLYIIYFSMEWLSYISVPFGATAAIWLPSHGQPKSKNAVFAILQNVRQRFCLASIFIDQKTKVDNFFEPKE